jgi:hypothetical protein
VFVGGVSVLSSGTPGTVPPLCIIHHHNTHACACTFARCEGLCLPCIEVTRVVKQVAAVADEYVGTVQTRARLWSHGCVHGGVCMWKGNARTGASLLHAYTTIQHTRVTILVPVVQACACIVSK